MSPQVDTAGRLRRLLAILAWLSQVGEAPVDEVADRFGLTPEALVSELELAACCGLPPYTPDQLMEIVVTDSSVSTRLGSALGRPRRLSPQEGFALAASARGLLAVVGSDPHGALSRALEKLDRALGGERLVVELDEPPLLPVVRAAADTGARLDVTYYSASTDRLSDRRIAPVRLFASEGHWYVDARCDLAGDVRRFRVDRISRAEPVEGTAGSTVPPEDTPAATGFDTFVPGPDTRTVRLSVDPSEGWLLESVPTTGPARTVGGRLEVEVVVGGDAWLERVLLRLGPGARVVDPPEDESLGTEAAIRILRRYAATKDTEKEQDGMK